MTAPPRFRRARIVVVTGLSGSGKSTATKVFEDIGYFCVDNLPPVLLPKIVDLVSEARTDVVRIALVADVRGREFLHDFARVIGQLRQGQHDVRVLFLDAGDDVLLLRYSETRRRHPLAARGGAKEAIRREREMLSPLREMADTVLNTSQYTVHQLRDTIVRRFRGKGGPTLQVGVVSFGYKYGIPLEADMVIDVRFLPNPNFVPKLKPLTGLDRKVRDYVMKNRSTRTFFGKLTSFLQFLLPLYKKEGKAYFTLGVGCTGGRHRSVVVAEAVKRSLPKPVAPIVVHRDIHRSSPPGRSPR
ncbi:MAG TPA: RNase adapter RapZ [Candidatus Deferrimicrobiaceae bacterium]|nr:RNase adapter RapZ [Candidatus Deferrimicrobiaceae bacterium]